MQINMNKIIQQDMTPLKELASFSKHVASEGIVLLKNNKVLPLIGKKIAVFGRIQFNYYKSGTGSGGLVNVRHVPSLIDALIEDPCIEVNMDVYEVYKKWTDEFPFDSGNGQWASEPWHQKEMQIDRNIVEKAAKKSDIAVVVFGRTAGEDKDNHRTKGSYYLTDDENQLINEVTKFFKKTVVILNVGNPVDLSFMDTNKVDGLVMAWHGGQYGALALKDVLVGYKTPSGKLPMSIVKDIKLDPSDKNFGHHTNVVYEEDIYVGYRYFETFDKDAVRFPFGYGLSYTKFNIKPIKFDVVDKQINFEVNVQNIGQFIGREVVQVYMEAPQGKLGKPRRQLVGFVKTKELAQLEQTNVQISIDLFKLASYDDSDAIYKSAWVLEKGIYHFYIGNSVRDNKQYGTIEITEDIITEISRELSAPNEPFKRIKPTKDFKVSYEDVPLRTVPYNEQLKKDTPKALKTNEKKYTLLDVYNKKVSLDEFIGSLPVDQLIELTRGEGMSSPKVTPGTAAAFGGVTNDLLERGIPVACAADGPSGIRMDSGFYASSLPIGILLASTFDPELVKTLYQLLGKEMKNYKIDVILGPGMNILRHPLNGRNFEYFSEDPLLTGIMGASVVTGLQKEGVTGTLKHLFANNQETDRFNVNAVVSERAQREIYLKGFEIAIKAGKAKAIMTSYNPVNGLWTASLYDVNKLLVHDEWGFKGIIMTDWWAKMNDFGKEGDKTNTKAMIISQNDLYMVIQDAKLNSNNDNSKEAYLAGELKLAHLQKVAKNILSYLLTTPAFARMHHLEFKKELRTPNPWFNATETKIDLPLLKSIKIDGKTYDLNALNFLQEFDQIVNFEKLESINGKKRLANYIEFNKDKSFGLVTLQNMSSSHIYYLRTKSNNFVSTDLIDLNTLENQSFDKVGEKVWTPIVLKLNEAIYNPSFVSNEDGVLSINQKDAVISFPLHFEQNGKYLVDFSLSSNASNLAQLPFSLYVDNSYKTTITISGSNGEKIWARASMLVDAKKSALSIKFNKSDLKIYEIKVMRHG